MAPSFLANVNIGTLTIGDDIQLPSDVSLITLLGCTGCDGPAWGVGRTYRDASGTVKVEPLLWTSKGALVSTDAPSNNLGLPDPPSGLSLLAGDRRVLPSVRLTPAPKRPRG